MRYKISLIAVVLLWSIFWSTPAQTSILQSYASDPEGGIGFNTAFWASSINRMVVMFGTTGPGSQGGDNSVRAFDPVTNTWTYLYTSEPPVGSSGHPGIPNRDNHASFYVPARDEIWIWGGSHIDAMPDPQQRFYSGRFSLGGCHPVVSTNCGQWVYRSLSYADHADIVKNGVPGFGTNPGCAWSTSANTGMCAFGGGNSPVNDYMIVEPNNARSICPGAGSGSQPYVACSPQGGVRPPVRDQCQNCMVAAGNDFYVYGGQYQLPPTPTDNGYRMRTDLWKYSTATHTWTQLKDGPALSLVLTYDSDRNQLVSWSFDHLYVYDLASGQWSDQTPAGMPCVGNNLGTYAPSVKVHVFEGGLQCSTGGNFYATIGVSLTGTGTLVPATSAVPVQPSAPASQTSSGHAPIGYLDAIDSNGIASGWTYDPDTASQSNDVQVYADGPSGSGTLIATVTTNDPRPDVNNYYSISGNHGFAFSIPANLKDGKQHQLYVYGIDKTGDANFQLNGSPKSFTLGTQIGSASTSAAPIAAPAPIAAVSPTPVSAPASPSGQLNLPVRTWVARQLPPLGQGPCSFGGNGGCKEVRPAFSYQNNRMYMFGGDYANQYWGTTFSYSILNNDWKVEHLTGTGSIAPACPDEIAWAYDSKRNLFYSPSGFYYNVSALCQGSPYTSAPLTFDPVTRTWSRSPFSFQPTTSQSSQFAVYDPVTDSVIEFGFNGGSGNAAFILHLDSNTWEVVGLGGDDKGNYANFGNYAPNNYTAFDPIGRVIYIMNPGDAGHPNQLMRYNIDKKTITSLGPTPLQQSQPDGSSSLSPLLAWDNWNKVVLWWTNWENADSVLYIYHPDSGTWEKDPMYQPDGIRPRGNVVAFDPVQNAFLVMGGVNWNEESNPSYYTHLFLYRYGNGDGKPFVPPTPTPVVTPPAIVSPPPSPPAVITPAPVATPPAVTQPSTSGPAGYTFCAAENQTCTFTGQKSVAYGANNKFAFLNLSGGTPCTNAVFGDPLYGTVKACFTGNVTQAAAPSAQIPTPTPAPQPAQTQPPIQASQPATTAPAPSTSKPLAVLRVSPSDSWCNAINSAKPGTDVILAAGTYTDPCAIKVSGKTGAPIIIRSESADPATRAVLAYQGSTSNVMDLSGSFLTVRWLSFSPTQDSVDAIRIRSGSDIIIEQNSFTGIGGVSVAGNDSSLQRIAVRDNTFKDSKYTVLYFGCQDGAACQATDISVERNLIDGVTTPYEPNAVGYGVQIKLNSSATIRDNTIYRTKGPGIMVYGSNQGGAPSLVEGNYVEGSAEEGGIVIGGGPAVVRNNILVGNAYGGVSAQDYNSRGLQKNIWIVHNSILNNADSGINVQNWTAGSGNVVAFNAIAPASGTPALRPSTPSGTVTGNVTCNPSTTCFEQPSRAPYGLSPTDALIAVAGGGTEPWRPTDDFMGNARGSFADVGALQKSPLVTGPLLGGGLPRPPRSFSDTTPAVVSSPTPPSPASVAQPQQPAASSAPSITAPAPVPTPAPTPPAPVTALLTIAQSGSGNGTVMSNDGGITCGTHCANGYSLNNVVTLTATPAAGSSFAGWSGTGCGPTVTMSGPRICMASFTLIPVNQRPTAKLAASSTTAVTGNAITFDASASSDPDGSIISYSWAFGDGTTGQGRTITHGYAKAGTYAATLTVTDNQGATGSTSVQINMSPPPAQQPCSQRNIRGLLTPCAPVAPPRRAG